MPSRDLTLRAPEPSCGPGRSVFWPQLSAAIEAGAEGLDVLRRNLTGPLDLDPRDRVVSLLTLFDLKHGPVGPATRWAGHPVVERVRWDLESSWLRELDALPLPAGLPAEPVAALRAIAARDRLPAIYRWLAKHGGWDTVVDFLAVEGGPDADFDDLVALCQVGLPAGAPKVELASNYWDELGNGSLAGVHTKLHDDLVAALAMPRYERASLPLEALERSAFCGLLAANHWLQPEMIGALGLIELQAGPRCRTVVQALRRIGAPDSALTFYEVHADVDPIHGKNWVDNAVVPLLAEQPAWGERIVRGAWWRSALNARFFDWAAHRYDVERKVPELRAV